MKSPNSNLVSHQVEFPATLCPVCQQKIYVLYDYPGWEKLDGILRLRKIGACPKCQLGVGLPLYDQRTLDLFYSKGEYWMLSRNSSAQLAHEKNQSKWRILSCIPYWTENAKVLDIGAGHGWISSAINDLKCSTSAYDFIEPDSFNSNIILSRNMNFPIRRVMGIDGVNIRYDFIFLNHILEHVADPIKFLTNVLDKLKPGGVIYIESPNLDYRFKKNVFPHTFFFSKKSFISINKKLGLIPLEISSFGSKKGIYSTLTNKILNLILLKASQNSMHFIERAIDDYIWKYGQLDDDGVWVRLLAKKAF